MTDLAPTASREHRLGVAMLLGAAPLWSLNGVLIRSLFAGGVGAATIAMGRSLVAAALLGGLAWRRRRPLTMPGSVVGAVLAFTGMTVTFVLATTLTSAANAIILQYTAPAWVFLLSPFLTGETAQPRHRIALGGTLAGVMIIFLGSGGGDNLGLMIALLSGLVFGLQSVLMRRVHGTDPVVLTWLCCAGSGALLIVPAILIDGVVPGERGVLLLVLMGVVQFGLPYVLYCAGMARVTAQEAILIVTVEPVLNPVWVWLGLGEAPATGTILGGAVILVSVLALLLWEARRNGESRRASGQVANGE